MRRSHQLKRNTKCRRMSDFIFFDTETERVSQSPDEERDLFLFGVACYVRLDKDRSVLKEEWLVAEDKDELVDFIEKKARRHVPLHLIANNIKYDLQNSGLLPRMLERGWEIKSIYYDGLTVIVRLKKGKYFCTLEDGMNRLRGSIEKWGQVLGLPKLKVDYQNVGREEFIEYCKRDVEILKQATLYYLRFVSDHDLGTDAHTIAGQAMAAFRHRFMNRHIYIHDDQEALELERKAYKGGMVRALNPGYHDDGPYYKLDVNSMYPAVMSEHKYPSRLKFIEHNPSIERLKECLSVCAVIAECTVKPKKDYFMTKHDDVTVYPLYEFTDVFCTPELIELLEQGAIIKVNRMAVYHDDYIFGDYVDYFYNTRLQAKAEGNTPMVEMCKLFLNSLYGKFGARSRFFERAPEYDDFPVEFSVLVKEGEKVPRRVFFIGGKAYVEKVEDEAYNAFPAIAAHVTAYARMKLSSYIEIAGREHVFYCDTDSLIVDSTGYERLKKVIDPSRLGMLKLEGMSDTVTVYGRKDYKFGEDVKRKGVSSKYLKQDPDTTIKETWSGFPHLLQHPEEEFVVIKRKALDLKRPIYDGCLTIDGKLVPFARPPATFNRYTDLPLSLQGPCPMAQAA